MRGCIGFACAVQLGLPWRALVDDALRFFKPPNSLGWHWIDLINNGRRRRGKEEAIFFAPDLMM